jgi:hypothetical protein
MKRSLFLLFILLGVSGFAQRTCGTNAKIEALKAANPSFAAHHEQVTQRLRNTSLQQFRTSETSAPTIVVTIPVVFHVLYKNATQNISDAQINSQLAILNNDYRKLNADFATVVPAVWQPLGADMEIVFVKASLDPNGNPTTGITRKQVPSSFVFEDAYYETSGRPAWDPFFYLNIWVGRFSDPGLLGFAYPPSAAGLPWDGLCIGDQYFGNTGTATAPFNKGRTATHEIGHYFGLEHPWGEDGSSCASGANSDGVADTPSTDGPYFGCPNFPNNANSCSNTANGSMFMNYMDYTNDACMAFFTNGQKGIVQNAIAGERATLLDSPALGVQNVSYNSIVIYPNPASQFFTINSPEFGVDLVEIYSTTGQLIKSEKIENISSNVSISDLASGIYYLRLYNEKQYLKSAKIVKN